MKPILLVCSIFLALSCNNNSVVNDDLLENLKNDKDFIEIVQAMHQSQQLIVSGDYNINEDRLKKIMSNTFGVNVYCKIANDERYATDPYVSTMAKCNCILSTYGKKINNKYPAFKNLSTEDKTKLITEVRAYLGLSISSIDVILQRSKINNK